MSAPKVPEKNWEQLIPAEPPEGLIPWLEGEGYFQDRHIAFETAWWSNPLTGQKERMSYLTCTACGGAMYTERTTSYCAGTPSGFYHPDTDEPKKSGDICICPMCESRVEVIFKGNINSQGSAKASCYPMTIHQVDGCLVLCGWCVQQWINKKMQYWITARPYEAYVVTNKKLVRLSGGSSSGFYGSKTLTGRWSQRVRYDDQWGGTEITYPWDATILEGTTAEHSKLDIFLLGDEMRYPVTYLQLWKKHPNLESLIVEGAADLINKKIEERQRDKRYTSGRASNTYNEINWKEKRPAQMLGLNKNEFKVCIKEEWSWGVIDAYKAAKEKGIKISGTEVQICIEELSQYRCDKLIKEGKSPLPLTNYLKRQRKKDARCDYHSLDDYWRMARREGLDIQNPDVKYPSNLYRAHERVLQIIRERRDREKQAETEQINIELAECVELLEPLSWEKDGILIRPARSVEELQYEGDKLSHCVGGYGESIVRGERGIFFVRKVESPDTPWFTVDLNLVEEEKVFIEQNRGKHNCDPPLEVANFAKSWLEHVKQIMKANQKGSAA